MQKISSHEKKVRCCYFRSLATALINMSLHSQCLQKFLTPILNYFTYFTYFTYLHAKVFSVQFSHDSTLLLTASMDGSARTCRFNVAARNAVWFLWGRPNGMGQRIGQTDATLPGFPTFRRVKTRSSSQAKISRFRCVGPVGPVGPVGIVGPVEVTRTGCGVRLSHPTASKPQPKCG